MSIVRTKYEKLDEYVHTLQVDLIQFTTEEMTHSIGKGPIHLGANSL